MLSPGRASLHDLGITRSWAKMLEFSVPVEDRIQPGIDLTSIADIALGIIGDKAAGINNHISDEQPLGFAAHYFDALSQGAVGKPYSDYSRLLAAASYYLLDYPGNATVLARRPFIAPIDDCGLGEFLRIFLADPFSVSEFNFAESELFRVEMSLLKEALLEFLRTGRTSDLVLVETDRLRASVYQKGTPRHLILADLLGATIRRHVLRCSPWVTLPRFSSLAPDIWQDYIARRKPFRELWPSQLTIGEHGIFLGKSGAIQIPTSGGKTKAVSLIIRCAFLSNRAQLAVVVAPFNALCREIAADLQADFSEDGDVVVGMIPDARNLDTAGIFSAQGKTIGVMTPEKLDYLLRAQPDIAARIGLIIYDEGHLIDTPSRGPMYELLLASLKTKLSSEVQVVFISAVVPNIDEIGKWLIGENCEVVAGAHLTPTRRSVAMVNWNVRRGQLQFVSPLNPQIDEFFVPRMVDEYTLAPVRRERHPRVYPEIRESQGIQYRDPGQIGVVLASRLVSSGGVAIFCGRKDSATKLVRETVNAFSRDIPLNPPSSVCNREELERLTHYFTQVLGPESAAAQASSLGILLHHGAIPLGARLCVEYAIQHEHAKVVVCTSTLAQGVNLPIRYLIVAGTSQGRDQITVRDFHNLIGRAGRAGKFTEGVIIFSDPRVYQAKLRRQWAWRNAEKLLNPELAGKCLSTMLSCLNNPPEDETERERWNAQVKDCSSNIESFLLLLLKNASTSEDAENLSADIAINTLAYHQGNNQQREKLISMFKRIGRNIVEIETDPAKREVFSRSGVALSEARTLGDLVLDKSGRTDFESIGELLSYWWPAIYPYIGRLSSSLPQDSALGVAQLWISGASLSDIKTGLATLRHSNRAFAVEDCVTLCENEFGFKGSLLVGSIAELISTTHVALPMLRLLQQALKVGLSKTSEMYIYNHVLADRDLAQAVGHVVGDRISGSIAEAIIAKREAIQVIVQEYPAYFRWRFDEYVAHHLLG